jgi:hypothetical protein
MFNLNDIIQSAHGGEGINNIAQQFGVTPEQAEAAIKAMLPGMSQGLQHQVSNGGLGDILGHIANPQNQQAFNDPNAVASGAAANAGGNVLGQIFGNNPAVTQQVTEQIAQHAAQHSGLSPDLLQQMMPVIASMVMGGLFKSASNQGLGGLLGQLTGQGNLGSILGQVMGGGQQAAHAGQAPAAGGGGLGGMLGGMLGGLFGGAQSGAAKAPGGIDPATVQAGMDALTKMFGHGVQGPSGQQPGLQDILGQLMGGGKR